MKYPRYPKYKDSSLSWLPEVPNKWQIYRAKNLFNLAKRPPQEDDGIVTAFRDGLVTLRSNRRIDGFTNALKEIGYQRVCIGDLVIHAMDAFAGAVGVSDSNGKCSPVYSCCIPNFEVSSQFYANLVRNMALTGFIESLAKGVRERSTDFRWNDFAVQLLPVPSYQEQLIINSFLDNETAKIDALITEQEKLITLLQEKRQAVIFQAVTKGLNPDAQMKDSGVEWLGEVPKHWNTAALNYRYDVALGKMLDEKQISGKHLAPYLRNIDVQWGKINTEDLPEMDFKEEERERFSLKPDDLLVCEGGDIGRCAVWTAPIVICYYQKALHRLRPRTDFDSPYFLFYVLYTAAKLGVFSAIGGKATIVHLPAEVFRRHRFPFPPYMEQQSIVDYLDVERAKIDALISESQKAVDLLKERRASLISAAVTGKIDVRNIPLQEAV